MILFYFKKTFRIFQRSSFATIITITITTIAVMLTTVSCFLVFSANTLSDRIKRSIEINVYLEDSMGETEIQFIEDKIRSMSVLSVEFISKSEATKKFLTETGGDFRKVIEQIPTKLIDS